MDTIAGVMTKSIFWKWDDMKLAYWEAHLNYLHKKIFKLICKVTQNSTWEWINNFTNEVICKLISFPSDRTVKLNALWDWRHSQLWSQLVKTRGLSDPKWLVAINQHDVVMIFKQCTLNLWDCDQGKPIWELRK